MPPDAEEPMIMTAASARIRLIDDPSADPNRPFLPGIGKSWLMPLYDPFTRLMGVARYRSLLIKLAGVSAGQRVLDVGCGTGSLLTALGRAVPAVDLTGVDPDRGALGQAARKAARAGIGVTLIRGYADRLPAEDESFDHVVSSLAVHHLDPQTRTAFAAEARRVLRPGGRITILDFGGTGHGESHSGAADGGTHSGTHGPLAHLTGLLRRRAINDERLKPNLDDGLTALLRDAGFTDAAEIDHRDTAMGPLAYVQATRS
jgi:SAM-dependent methyltransferase